MFYFCDNDSFINEHICFEGIAHGLNANCRRTYFSCGKNTKHAVENKLHRIFAT